MKIFKILGLFLVLTVPALITLSCANTSANIIEGTVSTTETGVTSLSKNFIINNKALARRLQIIDVQANQVGNLIQVQAVLKNRKKKTINFEYQIEWFNRDGIKIDYPTQLWTPTLIYGLDKAYLQGVAPDSRARGFKIHIRKSQPIE